jgi:hypothetical protein
MQMLNNNAIGKITEGFAASTRAVLEINKKNMAAVKAESRANFEEATAPDPGLVKVMQTKGLDNKIKVIAQNIKDGAAANSKREKERLEEVRNIIKPWKNGGFYLLLV